MVEIPKWEQHSLTVAWECRNNLERCGGLLVTGDITVVRNFPHRWVEWQLHIPELLEPGSAHLDKCKCGQAIFPASIEKLNPSTAHDSDRS